MMRNFVFCSMLIMLTLLTCPDAQTWGQRRSGFGRSGWRLFDPVDDISSRIFAQSERVRAEGDFAVNMARARVLHAEAVDLELDNWKKHVEVYWDRKIIRDQKQLELHQLQHLHNQQYLNDRKAANRQMWDRIANHPQLTSAAGIPQGSALNFLLRRLSATALVCEFVNEQQYEPEVFEQARLTPDLIHALQLQQPLAGSGPIVFRADQTEGLNLEWWPYMLRSSRLETARKRFESVRDEIAKEAGSSGGRLSAQQLSRLEAEVMEFTRAFYANYHRQDWVVQRGYQKRKQWRTAEAFLRSLAREVGRLQDTGDFRVVRTLNAYDPERDGDHLVGLLTYMTRNGLEFGPAAAGDEPAYHQLFRLMRDLYVLISDSDLGTTPEDLTRQLDTNNK